MRVVGAADASTASVLPAVWSQGVDMTRAPQMDSSTDSDSSTHGWGWNTWRTGNWGWYNSYYYNSYYPNYSYNGYNYGYSTPYYYNYYQPFYYNYGGDYNCWGYRYYYYPRC